LVTNHAVMRGGIPCDIFYFGQDNVFLHRIWT
jgi:hypothetical protein